MTTTTTTTTGSDAEAILEAAGAQRITDPELASGHGTGWLLDLLRPGQSPFDAVAMAWLSTYGSDNTVTSYRSDLTAWRRYLQTLSPPPDPMLVDAAHAAGFADWLERQAAVGERTRRRRITALSSCYSFAVARKVRRDNPFSTTRRPPKDQTVRGPRLSVEQTRQLLHAAAVSGKPHHQRDEVVLRLLARCEIGIGAICAANLGDLTLHSFPSLRIGSGPSARLRPLPVDVLDALRAYLPRRVDPLPPPPGTEPDQVGQGAFDPLFYLQSPRLQGQRISHGSRFTREAMVTRMRAYAEHCPAIPAELQDTLAPHDVLGLLRDEPGDGFG